MYKHYQFYQKPFILLVGSMLLYKFFLSRIFLSRIASRKL